MSIETYGIFIFYPPQYDLRYEGIGRYIIEFLRATSLKNDIQFLVACPAWSKSDLLLLCQQAGVPEEKIHIVTVRKKPLLLRMYLRYLNHRRKYVSTVKKILTNLTQLITHVQQKRSWLKQKLKEMKAARRWLELAVIGLLGCILLAVLLPVYVVWKLLRWSKTRLNIYPYIEKHEIERMICKINQLSHVKAWYSPAAFWPAFNRIKAPRLMCFPDIVIKEFPIKFAETGGEVGLKVFNAVEDSINEAQHFVTYSEHMKWNMLVQQYNISPDRIEVSLHAAKDLNVYITQSNEIETRNYCKKLFENALSKASIKDYKQLFKNTSVKFIFYASQFRPSKNMITLLRAYEYLLRKRYFGHKLILTGRPYDLKDVQDFILEHHLSHEVLCLPGLTDSELAACFHLADLAVNPSLSEGGMPFTFTEALSVNTPVIMAKIPVTDEVIKDDLLREMMLFNPYDWQALANRMEWALGHRSQLLMAQQSLYRHLANRTWTDVIDQHIQILRKISGGNEIQRETLCNTEMSSL